MRAAERWMWRGIGALVVGTTLHFTLPREKLTPPRSEQPSISALRLTDNNLALPELKLWGAGPPTAFHFHVAVTAPAVEPIAPKPEAVPLRRATPASVKQTASAGTASTPESRPAPARAAGDGEAAPAAKPPHRQPRKSASAPACAGQPVSFGADAAVDSPTHPRVTFSAHCGTN